MKIVQLEKNLYMVGNCCNLLVIIGEDHNAMDQ